MGMHSGPRALNQKEVLAAITFNQTKKIPPNGHKSFFDDPNFSHLHASMVTCFHHWFLSNIIFLIIFFLVHLRIYSAALVQPLCLFVSFPQIEVIIVFFERNILSFVPFIGLDEISHRCNIQLKRLMLANSNTCLKLFNKIVSHWKYIYFYIFLFLKPQSLSFHIEVMATHLTFVCF